MRELVKKEDKPKFCYLKMSWQIKGIMFHVEHYLIYLLIK